MVDVGKLVTSLVLLIVGIVILFNIVGGTSATLLEASDNISGSGLPFFINDYGDIR